MPNPSLSMPKALHRTLTSLAAVGVVSFGAGLVLGPQRAWADLLMVSYFLLELSLAAVFFIAVHHVAGGRWNVAMRRIPEAMATVLPVGAAGVLLVLALRPGLYPWFERAAGESSVLAFKEAWLSRPFFLIRGVAYLACWIFFAMRLVRLSYRQDRNADPQLTRRTIRLSAAFLVVLALTLVPASFDWIMSLQPDWYSTIFGFYEFASMFLGGLAAIVILLLWTRHLAPAGIAFGEQHLHDLGKLLFGFSTFWAYIWFCQYMLIWYGNISEETAYFVDRLHGGWAPLFVLNPLLNWAIPFGVLLSARAKMRPAPMLTAATAALAGRLLDLYLEVLRPIAGKSPSFAITELGMMVGGAALFALLFFRNVGRAPLMPLRQSDMLNAAFSLQEDLDA